MAVESLEQIMARLNNPYGFAPQQPKPAATDFTNYVQKLLDEPNPQGGMFRMQDIIDERMRKAKEEEAAKAAQAAGGMFVSTPSSGGSDSPAVQLTKEQLDFLERETPEERYARITGDWFGLKPIGAYLAAGIPGLMAQQGYTPEAMMDRGMGLFRQAMGNTSGYESPTYTPKPAGVAAPVVSGQTNYNTYTPDSSYYSAPGYSSAGNDGSSLNDTPDSATTGTGADVTYGDTSWGTYF